MAVLFGGSHRQLLRLREGWLTQPQLLLAVAAENETACGQSLSGFNGQNCRSLAAKELQHQIGHQRRAVGLMHGFQERVFRDGSRTGILQGRSG
jgi:hypothetical protein